MPHKVRVPRPGQLDKNRYLSPMPRRCFAYAYFPCPLRARHWSLTGDLRHSRLFGMCEFHFRFYNLMTRRWRRSEPAAPDIKIMHTDVPTLSGALHPARDRIYVTQHFGEEDAVRQVFVLAHESAHLVLRHKFGAAVSLEFDILYKRSLRCLDGHSLMTWELAALASQGTPAPQAQD